MKTIVYTAALVAACLGTSYAQNNSSDTSQTKDNVREKSQEVKQDVKEKSQEIKQEVKEKAQDVKQDLNEAADKAKSKIQEEYEVSRSYQERNQLTWFQKGSWMAAAALGFGTGSGEGTYITLQPKVGYFFQPGLMAGLQFSTDRRTGTSYRATQTGAFLRYYPWRTRISGFGGVGYNFGRERSSNISAEERASYSSVNLEIGTMFWINPKFGAELALESNYYNQADALAGRNRGGRFRFGINYFFGRANRF